MECGQNGFWNQYCCFKIANVIHLRPCLRGLHELICGTSLWLYCPWPSSWGESVDERVYHCSFDCKSSLTLSLFAISCCSKESVKLNVYKMIFVVCQCCNNNRFSLYTLIIYSLLSAYETNLHYYLAPT